MTQRVQRTCLPFCILKQADLETVETLIKTHEFSPTDLRGVLKAKRKRTTGAKANTTTMLTAEIENAQ